VTLRSLQASLGLLGAWRHPPTPRTGGTGYLWSFTGSSSPRASISWWSRPLPGSSSTRLPGHPGRELRPSPRPAPRGRGGHVPPRGCRLWCVIRSPGHDRDNLLPPGAKGRRWWVLGHRRPAHRRVAALRPVVRRPALDNDWHLGKQTERSSSQWNVQTPGSRSPSRSPSVRVKIGRPSLSWDGVGGRDSTAADRFSPA
jgi:hypothetical protein